MQRKIITIIVIIIVLTAKLVFYIYGSFVTKYNGVSR